MTNFVPPPPAYDPEKGTGQIGGQSVKPAEEGEKKPDSITPEEETPPAASEAPPAGDDKAGPTEAGLKRVLQIAKLEFPKLELDKKGNPKFSETDEKLAREPTNDLGNGNRFLARNKEKICYVEKNGWFGWDGSHWSFEDGERRAEKAAHDTATAMKREALVHAQFEPDPPPDDADKLTKEIFQAEWKKHDKRFRAYWKFAHESGNLGRLKAMMAVAQTYVAQPHDVMDRHPYLVTVENGILDLKPGGMAEEVKLLKHDPKKFISKKMNVKYDPKAQCPRFLEALEQILPDADLRTFLRTWYGYCLTGSVAAKAVLMMQGKGNNGKSMIVELMNDIFGNYACGIPVESIMAQKFKSGAGASPDLARLPGARVVTTAEPEGGMQYSESFIKTISGQDKMTVRRLREDFFEFYAQFKLIVSCNEKPQVRNGDEAFWDRIYLLPFEMKFLAKDKMTGAPNERERNPELPKILRGEASGILNWIIDGWYDYQEKGLQRPAAMQAAVNEYRAETNSVLQWINAWCDRQGSMAATEAYEAYELWAARVPMEPMGKIGFWKKLKTLPFVKKAEMADGNYYEGICLKDAARAFLHEHKSAPKSYRKDAVGVGGEEE